MTMTDNLTAGNSSKDGSKDMAENSFYYIRLLCYVIIFIVGVIGNILVCLVVCRQRKMKNVTNYFIFNLAVSDLSVLLICIPFDFGEIVTGEFPYGAVMCRLIYPLQTMATTASVGTLVAISLNRFMAVVYPLRPQLHTRDAKKVIGVIWVFALALVSPYMAVLEMDVSGTECDEDFQEKGLKAGVYTISIFLLQYLVPLSIIGLSYIRIGRDLRPDKRSYSNYALQRDQEKEAHKVMKILTVVVIVFALLMLPNHIFFLWLDFGNGDRHPNATGIMQFCQICVYANSAANPLIYNAVNEQFREGFKTYFRSWIECVLKIKGSNRREDLNVANRQNGAKPTTSCTICSGSSDTSLNGTLHSQKQQLQVNNNATAEVSMNGTTDGKVLIVTESDRVEEHAELLTSV
ncbi:neuropeptide FF receptor 2-like [Stylophora pistillata]|nr:neuropeptide FF receptor 2-like [Stylophora pistillata]XP_022796056.1 neuropeptide FF receptor 2-like [Stylophora pistillata]XP_022796057.1 neuropeptide FF receptor 2-like [Stylophora pistillata]XP_022796058.1 neuropeptide FF receptor 2-like [Stylophora pistillata]XP_022796059.1 neuropeptide FF receptor 2-like [Stylophora pistillata]XP_022796061.1 neuropeptide FF receptor 2-like [Stylophora pistillata]XP_022796062.1 neuropeptide FF receptor 2-like [Stylophora pistillata]XP_022796063.1 neu